MADYLDALPKALLESEDFRLLSEPAQKSFVARVYYILEIAENIEGWLQNPTIRLGDFLDDLELDVLVNLQSHGASDAVSPWQINSSWASDLDAPQLRQLVDRSSIEEIDSAIPTSSSGEEIIKEWLARHAMAIRRLLKNLSASESFDQAIASLVTLNVILSRILLGANIARFNVRLVWKKSV